MSQQGNEQMWMQRIQDNRLRPGTSGSPTATTTRCSAGTFPGRTPWGSRCRRWDSSCRQGTLHTSPTSWRPQQMKTFRLNMLFQAVPCRIRRSNFQLGTFGGPWFLLLKDYLARAYNDDAVCTWAVVPAVISFAALPALGNRRCPYVGREVACRASSWGPSTRRAKVPRGAGNISALAGVFSS